MHLSGKLIAITFLLVANYGLAQESVESASTHPTTYLGVYVSPVDDVLRQHLGLAKGTALLVNRVAPDSPAATGGILDNDILLRFDDQLLVNAEQFAVLVRLKKDDDSVILTLLRKGQQHKVRVILVQREMPVRPQSQQQVQAEVDQSSLEQLNQIYANPKLDDQEKSALINQFFRQRGLKDAHVRVSNRGISIDNKSPVAGRFESDPLGEVLKSLPVHTRKHIEAQIKSGRKVRILNTPSGPVFIMENSWVPGEYQFFIPGHPSIARKPAGCVTI